MGARNLLWMGTLVLGALGAVACAGTNEHLMQAEALRTTGRASDAVPYYEQAVQEEPESASAHRGLGLAYQKLNRLDEAETELKRSLTLEESNATRLALAEVLEAKRDDAGALEHFEVLRNHPEYRAKSLDHIGQIRLRLGHPDKALEAFQTLRKLRPDSVDAWTSEANALQQLGDSDKAVKLLKKAYDRTSDARARSDLQLRIGRIQEQSAQAPGAVEAYRLALQDDPKNQDALFALVRTARKLGQCDEALEHLMVAEREDEKNAQVVFELANTYRACGMAERAAEAYERTVALQPEMTEVYPALLETTPGKDWEKPKYERLKTVAGMASEDAELQLRWARAAYKRKSYKTSVKAFTRVVELEPNQADAYLYLGLAQLKVHNREGAKQAYLRLAELEPKQAKKLKKALKEDKKHRKQGGKRRKTQHAS
jgi:tetratricopeptide (TPR) repeat protein